MGVDGDATGHDAVSVTPLSRWDVEAPVFDGADEIHMCFGSFVPCIDMFDATAMGLSMAEAEVMDPQQRLLLEVFQEAQLNDISRAASRYCALTSFGGEYLAHAVMCTPLVLFAQAEQSEGCTQVFCQGAKSECSVLFRY